ncbi:hypothetical protein P8625_00130 [Tenacibaculum tangerinum]|uniref:Immunity protein 43 domain-containing protein n=1 Tax=Tenacibaculum tangerinum TaxID=3038772 RepID=A0ABY8L2W5_9FLAO|nr:hypothetical protein [Tenacibaculum tangerinum]WGH75604.1 hypothetical protein P8625_00130 [Tenacibaculum tangerinum]
MKYFELKNSRDRKNVGVKPQSEEGVFGDIQQDFIPWEGRIDFDFMLPEPYLEKKAKQVSLLDVAFIRTTFLVIDDDFLAFLKEFEIGNHQHWKIKTWQNKKLIHNYNLFLMNDTKQDVYIDFSNSEFYSKKLGDWDNSSIQQPVLVNDYDEYVSEKERLRKDQLMLLEKNVYLDLSKATEDMFRIVNAPPGGYFVSEKLKNAIEENGFTGMEFIEVSELDKVEVIY